MLLEAKNISFRYGKDTRQILEDFSLSVESHERVGIIAPSGFGKTTFCKILAGYEKPDAGEILLDGKPLVNDGWFTPMVLAIILLIMSIVNIFWSRPYFDWLILVAQTIIGCGMTYLIFFSNLCCTEWNWLIIPFNPLPAICWKWRKYWVLKELVI